MADAEWLNPSAVYSDNHHLEFEWSLLFQNLPLIAAHGSELPNTGDFVARDHHGLPVLLVRQADGSVKAFLNVCRHRASRASPADASAASHASSTPGRTASTVGWLPCRTTTGSRTSTVSSTGWWSCP
jgi:hypothetical protein